MDHTKLKIYAYKNCSTCRKAVAWLKEHDIPFEEQDIYEYPPATASFFHWIDERNIPLKKFLNTSGEKYREFNIKERLPDLTEDEVVALLASHGKLVKRPLLTDGDEVLIGFKEAEWAEVLL